MTPHATQSHLDGSVSIRIFAGGRWKVLRGAANGSYDCEASYYDCQAAAFVETQNRFVRDFHQSAVREYVGKGEAA